MLYGWSENCNVVKKAEKKIKKELGLFYFFEEGNKRGWAKKGNRMISIPARSTAHIFKDKWLWVIEIDNISREK